VLAGNRAIGKHVERQHESATMPTSLRPRHESNSPTRSVTRGSSRVFPAALLLVALSEGVRSSVRWNEGASPDVAVQRLYQAGGMAMHGRPLLHRRASHPRWRLVAVPPLRLRALSGRL
jgi:hypothetical protein